MESERAFNLFSLISLILVGFLLLRLIFIPIVSAKEIPPHIFKLYESMGVSNLDLITPIVLTFFVFAIVLVVTILIMRNIKEFNLKKYILKPKIKEGIIVFLSVLSFYIFNDALNLQAGSSLGIYEIGILWGASGALILNFIVLGFFASLYFSLLLIFRKYWDFNGKEHKLGGLFGVLLLLSYVFMFISTVAQLNGVCGTCEIFLGITRSTFYHLFAVPLYIGSLLYYFLFE